jgi:hypothetical protein
MGSVQSSSVSRPAERHSAFLQKITTCIYCVVRAERSRKRVQIPAGETEGLQSLVSDSILLRGKTL